MSKIKEIEFIRSFVDADDIRRQSENTIVWMKTFGGITSVDMYCCLNIKYTDVIISELRSNGYVITEKPVVIRNMAGEEVGCIRYSLNEERRKEE